MIEHIPKEENLFIIKEIEANPIATQRFLSNKLGISLGKINYLFKALVKKGFIKTKRFSNNPGKIEKIYYYLTKNGLDHKLHLMRIFLKKKEAEYLMLKQELKKHLLGKSKKLAV